MKPEPNLVHVVDDEESLRNSLNFLLRTEGYRVVRWTDGESFLKGVDRAQVACVLLDMRMPGPDGLSVQQQMVQAGIDCPVILLTGHGDVDLAVRAMKAGATDFLAKPVDREKLLQSVEHALGVIHDREIRMKRHDWAQTQLGKLTEREREVLDGLACGYPNKTIAYDLGISARTVEVYRANVMAKLEVTSFADALRVAFAAGLGSEAHWREIHQQGPNPRQPTLPLSG